MLHVDTFYTMHPIVYCGTMTQPLGQEPHRSGVREPKGPRVRRFVSWDNINTPKLLVEEFLTTCIVRKKEIERDFTRVIAYEWEERLYTWHPHRHILTWSNWVRSVVHIQSGMFIKYLVSEFYLYSNFMWTILIIRIRWAHPTTPALSQVEPDPGCTYI